ncbi:DUF932 domain-containing protein [Streptomyces sp. NPDC018019]|uniref:DUF932 domain-containing protein n=1 Tax=Streptomyces sp. NPDC018019 TaxID=3365030 RepID=UPI00379A7E4D
MSKETHQWLSENTLIGFTDKRGTAWHYRQGDQNHFPGAVPVTEVEKRLFDWTAEEKEIFIKSSGGSGTMLVPGRKAVVRSDNGHVMGVFKNGYQPHQYGEWLVKSVASILDDSLSIGSAGLLRGGAVAWVSVEVPDTIETPEGVRFRPNLLACASFDGSVATTFKRVVTNVVCDNTMAVALGERHEQVFKVKSTSRSLGRLGDARQALGIVYSTADDFAASVRELCAVKVDDATWTRIVNDLAPLPKEKDAKNTRARTMAENKRAALRTLWTTDERVAPWRGTAFGAWQAMNTYQHHGSIVRGMERPERNMLRAVTGETETADADTVRRVLALAA